ncbi:MAG: hypothetical protein Q4D30_09580 [Bacteroidales bacterium]|nr:hypothetical protein [Bacteroidales bacterium]
MKKTFKLFVSLTLGIMIASCQNGLEEVIDESAVQDELATTRAEDEESENDLLAAELRARSVGLTITGDDYIISGTQEVTFQADYSGSFYVDWDYNTSILYSTAGGDGMNSKTIKLKLVSSTNTNDTYVRVYLKSTSSGPVQYATTIYIGCNGPRANTSSLRVVRSSDGVEVYPSSVGFSPNTWYYAYFTNPYASNMTLQWIFDHATVHSQYGYTAYFKTDDTGWSLLTINGKMPGSTVYKYMMGVTLYEGYDNSNGNEDETVEENTEQGGDE